MGLTFSLDFFILVIWFLDLVSYFLATNALMYFSLMGLSFSFDFFILVFWFLDLVSYFLATNALMLM